MRKALAISLAALIAFWPAPAGARTRRAQADLGVLRGRTVAIDPGHGGDDPGAVGPGNLLEKRVVLDISVRIKQHLEAAGARAILTRDSDTHLPPGGGTFLRNPDLEYRVDVGNRNNADVLLSIHANKFAGEQWSGAQVFYDTRGVPDCPRLAIALTRSLARHTGTKRWIQTGRFYITHYFKGPAALVEVGFLSNPDEAANLQTPAYQEKLAGAIVEGLADFFAHPAQQGPPRG